MGIKIVKTKKRNKLSMLKTWINWQLKKGFKDVKTVTIDKIPTEWSLFGETKDFWIKLPIIEQECSMTSFLYRPEIGSIFEPHLHASNNEFVYFLEGGATIVTPKYEVTLGEGESIIIEKGLPHIFMFDKKIKTAMIVGYKPKMKGWTGDIMI